jgi:hypothetical protein
MRRLLGLVVRIYPTEWRRRYGEELSSLLHDAELSPSDVIDLMGWALRRRLESAIRLVPTRSPGGVMFQHANSHPALYALTGLAVLLPTATFIALALMKYVLGISGPFDAVEPTVTPFITDPAGETVLIVAPYVALGNSNRPREARVARHAAHRRDRGRCARPESHRCRGERSSRGLHGHLLGR